MKRCTCDFVQVDIVVGEWLFVYEKSWILLNGMHKRY